MKAKLEAKAKAKEPKKAFSLATESAELEALGPEAFQALKTDANSTYSAISEFIINLNPYGRDMVFMPDLAVTGAAERDPATLETRGIEVAGWLRSHHAEHPMSSSSAEMKLAEKQQCFSWDFRYPDDPGRPDADGTSPPRGGDMEPQQITKAIRVPFIYRRADTNQLLRGALLIAIEGSGDG